MAMAARVSKNRRAKNMHGSCTFSFVVDGSSALYAAIAAMISPVLAPPTPSARPRPHLRPWRRASSSPPRGVPRASGKDDRQTQINKTDRVVKITFVLPADADDFPGDEDDVREVHCEAKVGENLLSVAMRCGAVNPDDTAQFCLEGRCDSCLMEDVNTGEMIRGCQDAVDESVGEPMRLWIGGDGGNSLPVGPWVNDAGTNANDDVLFDEDSDDPFGLARNPIEGDPVLEWIEGDLRETGGSSR